ncbi:uncharacterized protein NECHADRAFT_77360 [Fusarium vanettenii 77-13-4]|uniref:Beta-glucuronidase C-terminal domain-containing protein n=1 Tax=Fusarium vanettenii (strain ATCC MYA-4622 / CBS 123669 / FGSC 9596 / NRRL 45880 / 77-13-4) TaxID=660122 RepID=C7YL07_FUSV7|nr:uncharacterized protein NECHADRAFT_77360 [Fusarium vanettenii 77-13-4]EEU47169.1 predicted protein [Fusarium vanettenii 77-13-4]
MVLVSKTIGKEKKVSILPLHLKEDLHSAYTIYANGALKRIVVINFKEVQAGATHRPDDRPYPFRLARSLREATVERLEGPGSDSSKNITFGGTTFAYESSRGRPVKLSTTEAHNEISIKQGLLKIISRRAFRTHGGKFSNLDCFIQANNHEARLMDVRCTKAYRVIREIFDEMDSSLYPDLLSRLTEAVDFLRDVSRAIGHYPDLPGELEDFAQQLQAKLPSGNGWEDDEAG